MPTFTNVSLQAEQQRCPHCAALVRSGAPWCTLCYADLRPPQPVAEPAAAGLDPLTAPLALLEKVVAPGIAHHGAAYVAAEPDSAVTEVAAEPLAQAAAARATTADAAASGVSWPCRRCGAGVAFDEPACTSCGAPFLEHDATGDPVLRRLGPVSTPARAAIMIGGGLGLVALFLGLMYIVGAVF